MGQKLSPRINYFYSSFYLFCFFLATALSAQADPTNLDLENLIQKADLIVEGTVTQTYQSENRKIQGYVGQSKEPVLFGLGRIQQTHFSVSHIFQGKINENTTIKIIAYPEIAKDVTDLHVNQKYIVFLKRHKIKDGFTILGYGRAQWQVFDYNGITKVKASSQTPALRKIEAYQDYENFIGELKMKLSAIEKNSVALAKEN